MKNLFIIIVFIILGVTSVTHGQGARPLRELTALQDIGDSDLFLVQTDSSGYFVWRKITGATLRDKLIIVKDTLTVSWGVMDTVTVGPLSGWKVPYDIKIVDISSFTDQNEVSFNIQERAESTPNTIGVNALSSDQVADDDGQTDTSFGNQLFSKDSWMVPNISSTGDVGLFQVTIRYVKIY